MSDSPEFVTTLTIIDNASKVLESIEASTKRVAGVFDTLLNIENRIGNLAMPMMNVSARPMIEVSDEALRMYDNTNDAVKAVRDLDDSLEDVGKTAKGLSIGDIFGKVVSNGANIFGAIQMASGLLDNFQAAVKKVDANTNMIARLGQVARDEGIALEDKDAWQGRAEEIRKMLSKQAIDLGLDVTEYSNNAITFANNPAFSGIEEASRFSELMSKQFFASGVGGQAQMSVINQLTQGLAKGRLQGEDLMSILSNAPDVGKLLEEAYARVNNVDLDSVTGKVRDLASEGKLTADVIKDAFFGTADKIEKNFEEMPNTFEDMLTKFRNTVFESFQPLMQLLAKIGNSESFKSMLSSLSSIIESVVRVVDVLSPVLEVVMDVAAKLMEVASVWFEGLFSPLSWGKPKSIKETPAERTAIEQRSKMVAAMSGIPDIAKELSSIGQDVQNHYKKLDDLVKETAARNAPKTIEAYENERLDALLKDNRLAFAESNAQAAAGEQWDAMDELEKIEAVKEAYNAIGETGINSAEDLKTFRESVKQGEQEIQKLNSVIEAIEANHQSLFNRYKDLDTQLKNRPDKYIAGITQNERNEIARINEMENERKALLKALEISSERYSEAFNTREELAQDLIEKQGAIGNAMSMLVMNTSKIDKNTRRVSINRDDILFMKNIATAQIINNYNSNTNTANFNQSFGSGSPAQVKKAAVNGFNKAMRGSSSSIAG